jgi:Flp pilus assembly protein TadD
MITGGEQKPGAARETRALGPNSGHRPEIRKEPPFLVVRKSFDGYVVASLTVLVLWGALAFGVVGCSTLLSRFGWLPERPGASAANVRQSPGEISRLLRNAHYYKLMGRPELALKELEQAHQQNPDNLKIINSLAQNYEELGKFKEARQLYEEGLNRHGPNPVLANNLCFTYYLEGRWQKAEACFRQVLARDPQNVAARNNLGLLYCRQGHQDKARQLWQAAEGDAAADYKVHQALAALGMYDGAVYAQRPEPTLPAVKASVAPMRVAAVDRSTTAVPAEVRTPPQPVAPKATTRLVTPKRAPQTPTPVAARVSPASRPEATVSRPLASLPRQVRTSSQPVTPKKASLQVAHKPAPQTPVSSNTLREKAQVSNQAQPVAPKETTRQMAQKPAPQTLTPVAAKVSPAPKPGVGIARLATRISAQVRTLAQLVTSKKSSQQVAQKPIAKMAVSSVTPQGKAQQQAAVTGQALTAQSAIAAANAPPLMHPRYLTCAELVYTAIEVRNGTWTRNLAHETRSLLSQEGFTVTTIGNHIDFGAKKTIIFYRPGAGRVARALGRTFFPIAELQPSMKLKKGTDVKILLGADLLKRPRLMARLDSGRP